MKLPVSIAPRTVPDAGALLLYGSTPPSTSSLIGSLALVESGLGIEGTMGLRMAPPGLKQGASTICSAAIPAEVHRRLLTQSLPSRQLEQPWH